MDAEWFLEATAHCSVGRQAREIAWEQTPLGPPEEWPHALRHVVRLCFSTRFPVMLVWGPDLTLIFNDGYEEMLGTAKQAGALGAPAEVVWHEIWDVVGPLFESVLSTGEVASYRDLRLVMNRSGHEEETFFTFSYSPLRDDDGRIVGVLDISTETTLEVVNQRRLRTLGELQTALPTTFTDLRSFARPVLEVLDESADVARAAFYDVRGSRPVVLASTGPEAGETETMLVDRVFRTRQRVVSAGLVVKPLRDAVRGGVAGILVLQASSLRPWDRAYARYLTGLASTVGAALRDAVRLRTTLDALRQRAQRSEEQIAQMREVALALQQAVLTEPPTPDHLEVAVHYQPAALDRDIGGDWYDAFVTPDGATTLVIGDVVGHDLSAAVTMGQLRGLVRAIGYDSQESPGRVLERVDAAVRGLALGGAAVATVLVARIEQSEEERRRGARTVRWSSAGHLPPMVVRSDGTVDTLTRPNDLPLGLAPARPRTEHTVELHADDTLVLYTDGLVERRGHNLRDDIADLARALEGTHTRSIEQVVEAALERMLPGPGEDDVALVVLRTGPEDPGPVEPAPAAAARVVTA
ncbi:SpoIIE family protein phosphatase [Cellulosimicrobium composti]|uniref:SpoIIE family protein phosphatase n=1 Tax=Cellulosimicrobium composti TaxID=2672572 RepID=A0A6N7ZH41_9MICO|nr:SpoIIE family protein phosphatase [Cellulosimicrobium composti]MTG88774.1 SpoIIE family protein phosphatase [Cellulosimicrobium composti]